jgi:hypothetical protein
MRNVLGKSCRENQNTFCSIIFFRKLFRLWDNVKKYGGARGATDVTIWRIRVACWISKATCTHVHAHSSMPLHRHVRIHTQLCNTCCFSTAAVVSQTCFSGMLHIHCLSCYEFMSDPHYPVPYVSFISCSCPTVFQFPFTFGPSHWLSSWMQTPTFTHDLWPVESASGLKSVTGNKCERKGEGGGEREYKWHLEGGKFHTAQHKICTCYDMSHILCILSTTDLV